MVQKFKFLLNIKRKMLQTKKWSRGTWSRKYNSNFSLKNCLFGGIKLAINTDPEKMFI